METEKNREIKEQQQEKKESLASDIRSYIETRIELLMLSVAEQISRVIAHSVQKLIGLILLISAVYFICFALGFYIGDLLGNYSYGFAIVSLPFLLAGIIFINRKSKRLTEKIQAEMISKMIPEDGIFDDDESEGKKDGSNGSKK